MGNRFSSYDPTENHHSSYCYHDSDVLINKENIRDAKILAEYEADITMFRQYQLEKEQVARGRFGLTHLIRIHQYIFQDIYPFAGKIRTETISKGSTRFCDTPFIVDNSTDLLSRLKKEDYIRGLSTVEFSQRAAYYMSELNMIHPFREGNGRSIREFMRQLALGCGYIIDWSLISCETLLQAMITSVNKGLEPLTDCIFIVIENK